MFGRFIFVRLNVAEKALRQGRIDDAYAALTQPELREQPRAEALLDGLVRPLVARARLHRQAGRLADALADLDRLAAIARATPDVQTLRQQVLEELRQRAAQDAGQRAACDRVAQHVRDGHLETGRLDLERITDPQRREQLAEELDVRVQRAGQLLQQAQTALDGNDVLAAARFWLEACQRHGRTQMTDEFAVRLAAACRSAIHGWVDQGQLHGLASAANALAALRGIVPSVSELERLAGLCHHAVEQFSRDDYAGLRETLLRLKAARGSAEWVQDALAAVAGVTAGREALLASPLGLSASLTNMEGVRTVAAGTPRDVTAANTTAGASGAIRLDRPLLVLVDGGGSALLVRRDLVRLGRSGGPHPIDVPIGGEVQSHHADIIRRGEDYFLTAYGPAEINGRRAEHALLRDGDRIVLGAGAKMVFSRPSGKSESAVLRLSHRSRLAQDVSDVVLFRGTCLLGPGASCHLRTHEGHGQAVLFERGGELHVRQTDGPGWSAARPHPILSGQTQDIGDWRITVKPYEA